jgi:hypothetical protein
MNKQSRQPVNVLHYGTADSRHFDSYNEHNESIESKVEDYYIRSSRMDAPFSDDFGVVSLQDKLSVDVPRLVQPPSNFEKRRNTAAPIESSRMKNHTAASNGSTQLTGTNWGERMHSHRVRQV